jgi:hypothetical protein
MRVRAFIAIVLLLVPFGLSAQRPRLPRIGGRRPPAELPPQPPAVARELYYKRLPLSVETYPLISHVQSSGFTDGVSSSWTSFGMGTRADYRLTPHLSATLDITSSFAGGPMVMETAEIGTRLRPERSERRVYPFVDMRVGYIYAYHSYFRPSGDVSGSMMPHAFAYGGRYSQGFGAVAGAGMEYALTRRFSLTTAATVMRNRMTAHGFPGTRPAQDGYWMTSYRYTLGIRYNPVRLIRPPAWIEGD